MRVPRVVGVLGGSSDQSTADYYRRLNQAVKARLGGFHTAELIVNSLDFAKSERWVRQELWQEAGADLNARALSLERAGAEILICVSNTLHRVADAFLQGVTIPFVHIVDPAAAAIRAAGLTRVALLGTKPVMATEFLRRRYQEHFGIETLVPDEAERHELDRIIFSELCQGRFTPEAKAYYLGVVDGLRQRGAEGVILGCTEIPLLIGQADRPDLPMFNTTALHVEAVVDEAIRVEADVRATEKERGGQP